MRIVITGEQSGQAAELELALAEFGLEWEVRWVPDPLADGGATGADVLVTGLPPDDDAGRWLAALRASHPDATRILLLEPGLDAASMHLLDGAHRVLQAPLDAGELIDAVESISDLRLLLDDPVLKRAIAHVDSLPPAPRMYFELMDMMSDPDVSIAMIADVLSRDPALAAKVLRLCNSAYFSPGREIIDIRSAVTRLGLQTLQQLVLASEVFGVPGGASGVDREAMQDRALRTSRLAGRLLGGPSAELAAMAGLLAEVGLLLGDVNRLGGAEAGLSHSQAGAYLLGLWGLPMPIVEAVAYHSEPRRMRATGFWVTGAVHVAAALVGSTPVDEGYLQSVGVLGKLPEWRELLVQQTLLSANANS